MDLSAQIAADSDSVKRDEPVLKKVTVLKDSIHKGLTNVKDTSAIKKDSSINAKKDSASSNGEKNISNPEMIFSNRRTLLQNHYFNFFGKIQSQEIQVHKRSSTDVVFYFIIGLCFYFALIRLFFAKYLNNLFSLFFRASLRQQQIREQALQAPLPSLLLNILFSLVMGLYACFITRYYHFAESTEFWLLYAYCVLAISSVYVSKFLVLKLCGWVFNITKASDNYIFAVFLVNKILGIGLLPFLAIIAFSGSVSVDIAVTISILMIAILLIYRFIACFSAIRSEIKLNILHYFIYLCAFEIAPLLLIYKVVLSFLEKAY